MGRVNLGFAGLMTLAIVAREQYKMPASFYCGYRGAPTPNYKNDNAAQRQRAAKKRRRSK